MATAQIDRPIYTSPNGASTEEVLQGIVDKPSSWKRHFTWESLTVAGRNIEKGLVVTPTMGLTIVLAVATLVGGMYYRTNDAIASGAKETREMRDMVIRMETRLDERTNYQKENESKREREQKDNEEIAKVWRETITQRMNDLDNKKRR